MNFTFGMESADVVLIPVYEQTEKIAAFPNFPLLPAMRAHGAITPMWSATGNGHALLIGMGDAARFDIERVRRSAGEVARKVEQDRHARATFAVAELHGPASSASGLPAFIGAWTEGWLLGTYRFDRFKQTKPAHTVKTLQYGREPAEALAQSVRTAEIRAAGTNLSRTLSSLPANHLNPQRMIEQVRNHFAQTAVAVEVYSGAQLEERQMHGLLTVGRGSEHPPAMVELRYQTDASKPLIVLLGKGVTFDTGGISLKSGRDLSGMRMDMSGAAAVVGALDILVNAQASVNVIGLLVLAENVPDARSMMPGDVIEYPNGISVQVANTDAEGRLVLADGLIHAQKLGAAEVVDIATLTGACAAALGSKMAGIWGDDDVVDRLRQSGQANGDKVWPMPLEEEYADLLKSTYADVSNIGKGTYAGAITAALFLKKFTDGAYKWGHIDMAGPMEADSTSGYTPAGARGYGARLLADYVWPKGSGVQ